MKTSDIRTDLKAFLDGEVDPERAKQIHEAVESQADLKAEADFYALLAKSLKAVRASDAEPRASAERLASRFERRGFLPFLRRHAWQLATAAGLLLIVVFFAPRPKYAFERIGSDAITTASPPAAGAAAAPETKAPSLAGKGVAAEDADFARRESRAASDLPSTLGGDLQLDRMVVRTAVLRVRVESVVSAERAVRKWVAGSNGFIEDEQSSRLDGSEPSTLFVVRVPEKRFDAALDYFQSLGVTVDRSIDGQDVTSQIVDLDQRIKTLKAQEETYRNILRQARRVGEVLEVQDYLTRIRTEIESIEAQAKQLKALARLSTITLTLEQRVGPEKTGEDPNWASEAWAKAARTLGSILQALATAIIYAFVTSPIWLPVALLLWLVVRRLRH